MEHEPAEYLCLRCKDVGLRPTDSADGYEFFKCPRCERRFTKSPGMTALHDRWGNAISYVLYDVIFARDPPAEAERVAATVAEEHTREHIDTLIAEIRLELADPVQQVRDILNQDQPEEVLREYLRLLADHLEAANRDECARYTARRSEATWLMQHDWSEVLVRI
ncbi:MAG: hypothetical protein JSW46_12810 [Gemmatimonadota bacterium]|nr:MAG: hypothetical protein JSW46_12810 [Gemmatimonadota bacterium]